MNDKRVKSRFGTVSMLLIMTIWQHFITHSVIGQTNENDRVPNVLKQESHSDITNHQNVSTAALLTNNVSIKGVLWGDCITNNRSYYVSILIKNNGRRAVYVPEACENVLVFYEFKGAGETASSGAYFTDNNASQYTKYVQLGRNAVKEYTILLGADGSNEEGILTSMHVKTEQVLSDYDREKLNEAGYPCIQYIECEFRDLRCVNDSEYSRSAKNVVK